MALLALSLVASCVIASAPLQPSLPKSHQPLETSGYVGVISSKDTMVKFGLVLREQQTQREYVVPLPKKGVGLIRVPPGKYRVARWATYAALTEEILTEEGVPEGHPLGDIFDLQAGQVVILGRWSGERSYRVFWNNYQLSPSFVTEADAVGLLGADYPGFATAGAVCTVCGRSGVVTLSASDR
jgi:hypothetical protein